MKKILKIIIFAFFLTSCTDYVQEIDEQYDEWKQLDAVDPSNVSRGLMIDSRDGRTYKTVVIGSQIWMAENLNYKTDNSFCYDDNLRNCSKYGRLYTRMAALGACPEGWHLPTKKDFEILFSAVGGLSRAGALLKSTTGWNNGGNGEDVYSFTALAAGIREGNSYRGMGSETYFWSSTEVNSNIVIYMYLNSQEWVVRMSDRDDGKSVRCIKGDSLEKQSSSSVIPSGESHEEFSSSSSSQLKNTSSSNTIYSSDLNDSSSVEGSSSSVTAEGAWEYLNPNIDYGEFVDSRDGQIYKTVVIGKQTWMAQNLNYECNNGTAVSYSIEERNVYGLLYTWAAAMDSANSGCGYGKQCYADYGRHEIGICPDGWRLPNYEDWDELYRFAYRNCEGDDLGICLKSKELWTNRNEIQGTDRLGFSALPAGEGREMPGFYGFRAYFWSATEWGDAGAYTPYFSYDETILNWAVHTKSYGFSIRCIKDEPYESLNDSSIGSLYYELGRELIDLRDNHIYRTSTIGSQIWMAENLNYENDSSICYGYSLDSCSKYGRLYQWHSAMDESEDNCGMGNMCNSNKGNVKGICPGGWHLPSKDEWLELFDVVGGTSIAGTKLKTKSGWAEGKNGDNYNYFGIKPSGSRNQYGFSAARYGASLWTSSEQSADSSNYVSFSIYSSAKINNGEKTDYMGIRCVKDDF